MFWPSQRQIRCQVQQVRGGFRAAGRGNPFVVFVKIQSALTEGTAQMGDGLFALPITDPDGRRSGRFGVPVGHLGRAHLPTITGPVSTGTQASSGASDRSHR